MSYGILRKIMGKKTDTIAMSSEVILRRCLDDVPFPSYASRVWEEETRKRIQDIHKRLLARRGYCYMDIDQSTWTVAERIVPEGLISEKLLQDRSHSALVFRKEQGILVNDQDHIKIFANLPGLRIDQAYWRANLLDDILEKHIQYAFQPDLGYLTANPLDCGTGMRVGIRIHLPALSFLYGEAALLQLFQDKGYFIEKNSAEKGSRGHVFYITNRFTLGVTERSLLDSLKNLGRGLLKWERQVRNSLVHSLDRRRKLEENIIEGYKKILEKDDYSQKDILGFLSLWALAWQEGIFTKRQGLNIIDLQHLIKRVSVQNQPLGSQCVKIMNFLGVISGEELCNV